MVASRSVPPTLDRFLNVRAAYGGRFDATGRLVFVSDLGGVPQVWALTREGWPELLVAPPDRAIAVHPGRRAGQLIVSVDVGGNERLGFLSLEGTRAVPLTEAPDRIHAFGSWSADGGRIAYAANTRNERWFDVYVRDLATGETRRVLEHDSTNRARDFAPDGRGLLVTRSFSNAHQELWLVDLAGPSAPRLVTTDPRPARYADAHWSVDGRAVLCVSDLGRETDAPARISLDDGRLEYVVEPDADVDAMALSSDGRWLAYALNRDGAAELFVRDLEGREPERRVEGLPAGALWQYWARGIAWDAPGERLAISWIGARENTNVWVHDRRSGRTRRATHAPRGGLAPRDFPQAEQIRYPTFDGREIPALYFAARRRGRRPPPCVVFVHGGPEGQTRPTFNELIAHLVASGFAVLAPNVRGSSGYGKTYLHLDDVRLRMDSVRDLACGVEWLRSDGRADPKRIAVYGGSYGGFMVLAALMTNPELWAAGVCRVGISNFLTFLERTGPWRRHLREAEYGSLENDREFLESISPINHVDKIRAPLLLIHGANDPRVPIEEAEQIAARLRELGRTVEFLRLDDEGHQISKLKNKLVAYPLAIDFLRKHLRA